MEKLTREQLRAALNKRIIDCSEDELRFMFHVLYFDLKEFYQETDRVRFEVHFKRAYVMRIEAGNGPLSFNNEWIDFGEGSTGVSIGITYSVGEIITIFLNMFGDNILRHINYGLEYNDNWSIFDSQEEAQSFLEVLQGTITEIINKSK